MGDTEDARRYHAAIWRMREQDGKRWHEVAEALGESLPHLAKIRLASIDAGLAEKDPATGRVHWRSPPPQEARP
jgi:hypothetical protein